MIEALMQSDFDSIDKTDEGNRPRVSARVHGSHVEFKAAALASVYIPTPNFRVQQHLRQNCN